MNENFSREDLRQLIAMGKEAQALKKMMMISSVQSKEVQKLIALQSNRFQKLKKKRLEGTIDQASANVAAAKISSNLFEILESIQIPGEENEKLDSPEKKESEAPKQKKSALGKAIKSPALAWGLIIAGFLVLGGTLLSEFGFFHSSENLETIDKDRLSTKSRGKEKGKEIFEQKDWLGEWTCRMEGKGIEFEGIMNVYFSEGRLEGKCIARSEQSYEFTLHLKQIEFFDTYQKIAGIIESEEGLINTQGNNGTFSFILNRNKENFSGTYTTQDNTTERFSWKGEKIK